MPRRHWRVRGENTLIARGGKCFVKIVTGGHFFADELQCEKCRMALVHMKHAWCFTQGAHEFYAADAEKDFLLNACGGVTAVHSQSEITIMSGVFGQIGVEQV